MRDRRGPIEDDAENGERERAVAQMFRLQAHRQQEENHRSQFQLGKDCRIGHQDSRRSAGGGQQRRVMPA